MVNGIYLSSCTFLTDKIFIRDTEALNAPMLIGFRERLVKKQENVSLKVNYIFGNG